MDARDKIRQLILTVNRETKFDHKPITVVFLYNLKLSIWSQSSLSRRERGLKGTREWCDIQLWVGRDKFYYPLSSHWSNSAVSNIMFRSGYRSFSKKIHREGNWLVLSRVRQSFQNAMRGNERANKKKSISLLPQIYLAGEEWNGRRPEKHPEKGESVWLKSEGEGHWSVAQTCLKPVWKKKERWKGR